VIKFKNNESSKSFEILKSDYLKDSSKNEWLSVLTKSIPDSVEFDGSLFGFSITPGKKSVDMYNLYFQTRDKNILSEIEGILKLNGMSIDLDEFSRGRDRFLKETSRSGRSSLYNFYGIGVNFVSGRRVIKLYVSFSGCDNYFEYLLNTYHNSNVNDLEKVTGLLDHDQRFVTYYFEDGKPVSAVVKLHINDEYKKSKFALFCDGMPLRKKAISELSIDRVQLVGGGIDSEEVYFEVSSVDQVKPYIKNEKAFSLLSEVSGKIANKIAYLGISGEKLSISFLPEINYQTDTGDLIVDQFDGVGRKIDRLISEKKYEEAENMCLEVVNTLGDKHGMNYRLAHIYGKGRLNKPDLAIHYFAKEKASEK